MLYAWKVTLCCSVKLALVVEPAVIAAWQCSGTVSNSHSIVTHNYEPSSDIKFLVRTFAQTIVLFSLRSSAAPWQLIGEQHRRGCP